MEEIYYHNSKFDLYLKESQIPESGLGVYIKEVILPNTVIDEYIEDVLEMEEDHMYYI